MTAIVIWPEAWTRGAKPVKQPHVAGTQPVNLTAPTMARTAAIKSKRVVIFGDTRMWALVAIAWWPTQLAQYGEERALVRIKRDCINQDADLHVADGGGEAVLAVVGGAIAGFGTGDADGLNPAV